MNKQTFQPNGFTQIKSAIAAHERSLETVRIFTPAYYFAKAMIARGNEALKMDDHAKAYRYFIGSSAK